MKEKEVMMDRLVLKHMLGERPLDVHELKKLHHDLAPRGVFFVHGILCGFLTSPEEPEPSNVFSFPMSVLKFNQFLKEAKLVKEAKKMPSLSVGKRVQETRLLSKTELRLKSREKELEKSSFIDRLYHQTNLAVSMDPHVIPVIDFCPLTAEVFWEKRLNPEQRRNLQTWCDGYMATVNIKDWFKRARNPSAVTTLLSAFTFLCSDDKYAKQLELSPTPLSPQEYEELTKSVISIVPVLIVSIFNFWRLHEPQNGPKRSKAFRKILKNDPCPCLSEKKYRDCCHRSHPVKVKA